MAAILVVILLGLAWYSNPTPNIASAPRRLATAADAPSTSRRTSASLRTVESQFVQGRDGAVNDERGESLIEIRRDLPSAVIPTYARNYAGDRPLHTRIHPPPAKHQKENPSASPGLTEGFHFARLLDRPVW